MDPSPENELVARLRERVGERREDGLYPDGLEDDLDLHFHHIAVRGVRDRFERLRAALDDADAVGRALSASHIGTGSERVAGGFVHRLVARMTHRQTEGALTQVREYAEALAEAHRALLMAYADLVSQVDDLRDRLGGGSGEGGGPASP
ncbi:MAG TPA: hypothetical protein VI916_10040 [Acidimicrobiia bacterium]|nr:hypothetical protein [Acidimicrobiia bacterium]